MTTKQYRTISSSGQAGRACGLAGIILSAALLAAGCVGPYGAATRGDIEELRKAQDENFQNIKFTLNQISANLDTQRQTNGNDVQTTLDQLAHIRQDLNTLTGNTHPVAPAVRTPPVAPAPTPMAPAPTPIAPVPTRGASEISIPVPPEATVAAPVATPQPDTPARQEEMLRTAKDDYSRHNFDQAIETYSAYLKNNPKTAEAPTAAYYLASSYYSRGSASSSPTADYEKALAGYKFLLDNYPNTEITPQTLLARAMCEINLKRDAEAHATLQKLQSTYPSYDPDNKVTTLLSKTAQP